MVEAHMENTQGAFNNTPNPKYPSYPDVIIRFSHSRLIDRLQFTLDNRYAGAFMGQLKSLFEYIGHTWDGRKFIRKFSNKQSLIEFVRWGRRGFNDYALIVHDPDIELQEILSRVMGTCPMRLSQMEVAFDFIPDYPCDLYDLRRIMTDGIVLKYSRPGCYVNYSGLEFRGTEYIGKGGVVRRGSKGLRVYNKQKDGRLFLRMELQFNRPLIKKYGITLPVHADSFNLFDYVDYRGPLDEDRLLKVLRKKWRSPIERASDVEMLRSLEFCGIYSWILTQITFSGLGPVCDQMSRFKQNLERDNLAHRVSEFFPRSGKKVIIAEGVQKGFVQRECLVN